MLKENILPSLVLTAVCTITAALLVFANAVTEKPIAKARRENTLKTLSATFGEGDYTEIEWKNENVSQTYLKDDGTVIFKIIVSGYNKDSIDLLIGVDANGIKGIGAIEISETKGVGTKVGEKSFLSQFDGASAADDIEQIDAISGATYSSDGVKNAAICALEAFAEYSEGT